ncbi:MAG: MBL fold metallo-hydrolase [Pseudanabaenaceae cyanobacterium bins.68]|nr:MBL fold metallo-hydrolase [Pseudanabaenaceae cyanobacterium bins.68]
MHRRQLFKFGRNGLIFAATFSSAVQAKPQAPAAQLSLQWLGHMSFLISGSGTQILTHPFRSGGCTSGFALPKLNPDLVLISSRLLDEGYLAALPANFPNHKILTEPGAYSLNGIGFQGIRMAHDRLEGRRFGTNVAWLWNQGGVRILHLGGAAAPLSPEQRILMGRPNILILPVGGGDKGYNAAEAKTVVDSLNPQLVIPVHFRTPKSSTTCELETVDQFLGLYSQEQVRRLSGNLLGVNALPASLQILLFKTMMP